MIASAMPGPGAPLFPLGQIIATPGTIAALEDSGESFGYFISRHAAGDWGDICTADAKANHLALEKGARLFSVYHTMKGAALWLITEADRSSTCLLLPEY